MFRGLVRCPSIRGGASDVLSMAGREGNICMQRILRSYRIQGWRDDSVVQNAGCSCRGPVFGPQHLHDNSQLPLIPVLGEQTPSSGLPRYHAYGVHTYIPTRRQNTCAHKMKIKLLKNYRTQRGTKGGITSEGRGSGPGSGVRTQRSLNSSLTVGHRSPECT